VLSYNVENLFDDRERGTEYPQYRSPGWTRELYHRKLAAVARAVRAASPGGPDILCLQEIESEAAVRELRDRHLRALGYNYLVFVPQEGTATTVACLSRLPVVQTRVHEVGRFEDVPLRHILEIRIEHEGSTLYLFNNHWKSKTGGVQRTAAARRAAASILTRRVREILDGCPRADLLVLGDLNENLDEREQAGGRYRSATVVLPKGGSSGGQPVISLQPDVLFVTACTEAAGLRGGRVVLYEPWFELPPKRRGSSVYQGRWQTPDRILLSAGLFDGEGFHYVDGSFAPVTARFLLDPGSGFPRRWQSNPRSGGTSDHLPVRLALERL